MQDVRIQRRGRLLACAGRPREDAVQAHWKTALVARLAPVVLVGGINDLADGGLDGVLADEGVQLGPRLAPLLDVTRAGAQEILAGEEEVVDLVDPVVTLLHQTLDLPVGNGLDGLPDSIDVGEALAAASAGQSAGSGLQVGPVNAALELHAVVVLLADAATKQGLEVRAVKVVKGDGAADAAVDVAMLLEEEVQVVGVAGEDDDDAPGGSLHGVGNCVDDLPVRLQTLRQTAGMIDDEGAGRAGGRSDVDDALQQLLRASHAQRDQLVARRVADRLGIGYVNGEQHAGVNPGDSRLPRPGIALQGDAIPLVAGVPAMTATDLDPALHALELALDVLQPDEGGHLPRCPLADDLAVLGLALRRTTGIDRGQQRALRRRLGGRGLLRPRRCRRRRHRRRRRRRWRRPQTGEKEGESRGGGLAGGGTLHSPAGTELSQKRAEGGDHKVDIAIGAMGWGW